MCARCTRAPCELTLTHTATQTTRPKKSSSNHHHTRPISLQPRHSRHPGQLRAHGQVRAPHRPVFLGWGRPADTHTHTHHRYRRRVPPWSLLFLPPLAAKKPKATPAASLFGEFLWRPCVVGKRVQFLKVSLGAALSGGRGFCGARTASGAGARSRALSTRRRALCLSASLSPRRPRS